MTESKILIIDDEEVICDTCTQMFKREGYCVDSCHEGDTGVRLVSEFQPDVVFVDIRMPGMNGLQVLERIREIDESVVAVMITGYATIETAVESMKKGAFDFLAKPFSSEKLKETLRKAIAKRKALLKATCLAQKTPGHIKEQICHVADLVAFIKPLDCPPALNPYAKAAGWNNETSVENDDSRLLIFKIRGTIDSYHAIVVDRGADVDQVDRQVQEELEIVRLSDDARDKLAGLLERSQKGNFVHYINHRLDGTQYPYRH